MFFKVVLVWKNIGHLVCHWKKRLVIFPHPKGLDGGKPVALLITFLKLFNRHLAGTPWWHLFSDFSIWEALFSKVDHADQIGKGYSRLSFSFALKVFCWKKALTWKTKSTLEMWGISHRPETSCRRVSFWEMPNMIGGDPQPESTWNSPESVPKKLRSLLLIFQTKIATTQTMTASKWRKEAYVIFIFGCATVIFPDFCVDETTIVFKLQIEALGEIRRKSKVQLVHHSLGIA